MTDPHAEARRVREEAEAILANPDLWRIHGFASDFLDLSAREERLWELQGRAEDEPIGVDISDYSDEFCAGFLAGQANALDALSTPKADDD